MKFSKWNYTSYRKSDLQQFSKGGQKKSIFTFHEGNSDGYFNSGPKRNRTAKETMRKLIKWPVLKN